MTDTHEKFMVEDRMQSALAMTHHIQMRIGQCLARGEVSDGIAEDVGRMCESITDAFDRAAKARGLS